MRSSSLAERVNARIRSEFTNPEEIRIAKRIFHIIVDVVEDEKADLAAARKVQMAS